MRWLHDTIPVWSENVSRYDMISVNRCSSRVFLLVLVWVQTVCKGLSADNKSGRQQGKTEWEHQLTMISPKRVQPCSAPPLEQLSSGGMLPASCCFRWTMLQWQKDTINLRPKLKFYLFPLTRPTLIKALLKKFYFNFQSRYFFFNFIASQENCTM